MFLHLFDTLGGKNAVNTDVFALRKPKTTVFTVFSASSSKTRGIYSGFCFGRSKNSGIYAVFTLLQDVLLSCEEDKNTVICDVFASRAQEKSPKNGSKTAQNRPPKASSNFSLVFPGHLLILASFFPALDPKNVKTPAE